MSDQSMATYTPQEVSIPPTPDASFFTEAQWTTLFALADAVVPSIRASTGSSSDKVISTKEWDAAIATLTSQITAPDATKLATRYLEEDVSSNPAFKAYVYRIMGDHVPDEGRAGFGLILNALKYTNPFPWVPSF